MTNLSCSNLVGILKSDFGALWHCLPRGNTLEIITPYLYPDNSFISIFVTKRGNKFIVSDAGEASEFFESTKGDEPFFESLISKARTTHKVEEYKQGQRTFYFKSTTDSKLISSIAFDLANFLVASSNAADLTTAEDDSQDKNSFRVRADTFIKHVIPKRSGRAVGFNKKLPEIKEATFSAVITSSSRLWLVIYLTGSNLKYFQLSTSNAIWNVEQARKSSLNNRLGAIVPLLNDDATGYQPNHLTQRLHKLSELAGMPAIPWRRKEDIISKLN